MKSPYFLLEKYLFSSYIRSLFIGILGGTILLSIEKLFGLATDLVVDRVSLLASLQVFLLDIPSLFVQALPFAVLFSTLMTLRMLHSNGELVALQAAGVSYRKIAGTFICVALTVSLLSFGVSDSIIPLAQKRIISLNKNILTSTQENSRLHDIFYKESPYTWLFIKSINPTEQVLNYVSILRADRADTSLPAGLSQVTLASLAKWDGQNWILSNGYHHYYDRDRRLILETFFSTDLLPDISGLQQLLESNLPLESLSLKGLNQQISLQSESNLSTLDLETEWHLRFAQAFGSLLAVAISLPLAAKPLRSTGRYRALTLAVVLLFFYRFGINLGISLAQAGAIQPWLAVWSSNLIFAAIAFVVLQRTAR